MSRVTASAPGKLFLAGEYAVLAGAPALVAAVDRRAHVRAVLEPGAGPLDVESLAEGTRRVIHDPERDALGGGDAGAVLAALRIARTAAPSLAPMRAQNSSLRRGSRSMPCWTQSLPKAGQYQSSVQLLTFPAMSWQPNGLTPRG